MCEKANEWAIHSCKCSATLIENDKFWLKETGKNIYYAIYLTQTNFDKNCVTVEKYFSTSKPGDLSQNPEVKNFVSLKNYITEHSMAAPTFVNPKSD